ncbi:unc50 RNA binding protein [Brevipalpus obovatus]|uniref:unc50 RNA binding protein n=1 Tax=Brevipalpus obovatus TaxID=246614 RepID=UPI003D9F07FE
MMSDTLLPSPVPFSGGSNKWKHRSLSAVNKSKRYLARLVRLSHMDFEYATWQMIYLFISPSKVYRSVQYRKQTKNQYSRDDPAFLVLLSLWFVISATGLSLVLRLPFLAFIKFLFWVVFVDCIGVGLIVATVFWFVSNRYFRADRSNNEDVEWGFSFDVHLNAFFPPLIIIHVIQLLLFNALINSDWFLSRLFGNTLWFISSVYYAYITFLGYGSLPHLKRTQIILYPLIPLFFFYMITLVSGINICRVIMDFYKYRVYY